MHAQEIIGHKGGNVATVAPDASVAEAVSMLRVHNIGALVVSTDGSTVDGIISERDIVRALASDGADTLGRTVGDLMVSEVVTCGTKAQVAELMELMTAKRIRHVPVVEDGALAGIISIGDVVKQRVTELETEASQLVDYIRTGR
jgi:CBS domain-containing protein